MIRPYRDEDLEAVVSCFGRSVHVIGGRYYAREQVAAWAPESPDMTAWRERLRSGGVFVAEIDGRVAGFARAEEGGLVDLLYVHPDYERRGLGRELLASACSWVLERAARTLEAEVSIAARPLFEAMGFRVAREQAVERSGLELRNFHMVRRVETGPSHPGSRQRAG